jgi:hypothetical protein
MDTMTEHRTAIVRDATVHDLRRMVKLIERLIAYEDGLGGRGLLEDEGERKQVLTDYLAQALFRNDMKIILVEKSGNVLGIFILEIEIHPPFNKHTRVCNIWAGYAKRNPVYIKKITNMFEEWAREKGCTSMKTGVIVQNEKTQRLMRALGYSDKHITFEKEVGE